MATGASWASRAYGLGGKEEGEGEGDVAEDTSASVPDASGMGVDESCRLRLSHWTRRTALCAAPVPGDGPVNGRPSCW